MRRRAEEEQRKRTASDVRRPDLGARRRDMATTSYNVVVPDDRPRAFGYSQAPRNSRPNDVHRPQMPQGRRPSHAGHRPSQSRIEQEYMTDQILMHLYPEREIRPRWYVPALLSVRSTELHAGSDDTHTLTNVIHYHTYTLFNFACIHPKTAGLSLAKYLCSGLAQQRSGIEVRS